MSGFFYKYKGMGQRQQGFTLVELLVVIAIISIMSLIVMLALNPVDQLQKASDSRRKSDLSELRKALEIYYQDHQQYPAANSNARIVWGTGSNAHRPYISANPSDPARRKQYVYWTSTDRQMYAIYANLDRGTKDPQVCTSGTCPALTGGRVAVTLCGGSGCNYGVASPNTTP